ncbi:MAG: hypothetical protein EBT15_11890 [Betaproteobacteria bacterium]|nr:hypothetical protein [Betaproteobacteria bacterium]
MRGRGGFIGANVTPASAALNSAASGVWTVREAEAMRRAGTWPRAPIFGFGASLQLWLDASDASTLYDSTSGGALVAADGAVARWEDKSGNARHAKQATSDSRPQRKVGVFNGLDILRFDGSDDFLDSTDFLDLTSGQQITIVAAVKSAVTGVIQTIVSKYGKSSFSISSTADGWMWRLLDSNKVDFSGGTDEGGGVSRRLSDNTVSASGLTVLTVKAAAGSLSGATLYRNSSTIASSATASNAETLEDTSYAVTVGALRYTFNHTSGKYLQFFNGDIAEIIVYNSALSDADRNNVESYLMSKWGIT